MNRPRRQVFTLDDYLERMKDQTIRSDQDVQRMADQWDASMINELVATVLTDNYIPPVILGEQPLMGGAFQMYIIDGLQRSSNLMRFRYGNYKITSSVENNIVKYSQRKIADGKPVLDENGNFTYELVEYNIIGKTYDLLPKELQKKFNSYQLETVIHEECDMELMSTLVRRYNSNKGMNASQRSFTYVDKFAKNIRSVINNCRFFKDCGSYTENEKKNGTLERTVEETLMTIFHIDDWKKNTKKMGQYINENSNKEEFEVLRNYFNRLETLVGENYKNYFNTKNTFIFVAAFDRFVKFGLDDSKFADFLEAFEKSLHNKEIDGVTYDILDENRATKDKSVVTGKIEFIEKLMRDFFQIEESNEEVMSDDEFISSVLGTSITKEDIEMFDASLYDYSVVVDENSKLLNKENRQSLLAMVAYAFDKQLDEHFCDWLEEYTINNNMYLLDQRKNYLHMVESFKNFIKKVA